MPHAHPTSLPRRTALRSAGLALASAAAAAVLLAGTAHGQAYPNKPIKVYVGYAAGGAVDIVARSVGQAMSAGLGQQIVVDNKPGAGSNIAIKATIDSPPDGYTLLMAANALAANMALYQPAPFDAEKELTPVSLVGTVPVVIAADANSAYTSLAKLIELARAKPGDPQYASPGNGSTPHLAIELFARAAGIQLSHIPYKGGAPAMTDVMGGRLPLVAVNALEALPHVKAGKLRILAVLSAKRSAVFPDAPTIAESGYPGFEASVWYALMAPAGTPKPIVERLHAETQKALASKDVRERMAAVGGEVIPGTVEQLAAMIHSERIRYEKIVRDGKIKPD